MPSSAPRPTRHTARHRTACALTGPAKIGAPLLLPLTLTHRSEPEPAETHLTAPPKRYTRQQPRHFQLKNPPVARSTSHQRRSGVANFKALLHRRVRTVCRRCQRFTRPILPWAWFPFKASKQPPAALQLARPTAEAARPAHSGLTLSRGSPGCHIIPSAVQTCEPKLPNPPPKSVRLF
jgi:hypothetical protein